MHSENRIFDLAEKFILQTSRSLFLTGKAGTGKTTFLKKIKSSSQKNTVVVAPTGVAAINAGGTTIHSFFQLPFSPFIPVKNHTRENGSLSDRYSLLQNLRIESEKRKLFRELELLIIDEVSMVRCDVLDSMDIILRHYRKKEYLPFGGVQVLYIGDLFQLPPVVQPQEWSVMREFYESPFFFDSHVIREAPPLYIELKKIYRQRDDKFIDILNRVRNNEVNNNDINILNERYDPDFVPGEEKFITLTTHNLKAEKINNEELGRLPDEPHVFEAGLEGDFPERSFPTEKVLTLRKGAQIMFVKNDTERIRRYYNGKIGTISRIEDGKIFVCFPGEEGELEVEKDTWRNMRYSYNSGNKMIDEEVIGTFTQYAIRLAWAITIHKSQGLTFERAVIDAGSSFSAGQVYVALSRCTSLEGVILKSKIFRQSIMTDERVLAFSKFELATEKLEPLLEVEKQQYVLEGLIKIFDWSIAREEVNAFRSIIETKKTIDKVEAYQLMEMLDRTFSQQQEIALKFSNQLRSLMMQQDFHNVRTRVAQGIAYFTKISEEEILKPLNEYLLSLKTKKKVRKYLKQLNDLIAFLKSNQELYSRANAIAENIENVGRS